MLMALQGAADGRRLRIARPGKTVLQLRENQGFSAIFQHDEAHEDVWNAAGKMFAARQESWGVERWDWT